MTSSQHSETIPKFMMLGHITLVLPPMKRVLSSTTCTQSGGLMRADARNSILTGQLLIKTEMVGLPTKIWSPLSLSLTWTTQSLLSSGKVLSNSVMPTPITPHGKLLAPPMRRAKHGSALRDSVDLMMIVKSRLPSMRSLNSSRISMLLILNSTFGIDMPTLA